LRQSTTQAWITVGYIARQHSHAQTAASHRLHGRNAVNPVLDTSLGEGIGYQHAVVKLIMPA